MSNETSPVQASAQAMSGAGAAPSRASTSGAAKVFREFKWGLLTLFLLMVVVIGLVYDGGRKKEAKKAEAPKTEQPAPANALPVEGVPPGMGGDSLTAQNPTPATGILAQGQPPVIQEQTPSAWTQAQTPSGLAQGQPPRTIRTPELVTQPPLTGAILPPVQQVAVAPPIQQPTPAQPLATSGEYVVQPGDTLEAIARKNYPGRTYTGIKAISEANGISDPRRLRAGMTLKMPVLPEATATAHTAPAGPTQVAEPLTPSTPRSSVEPDEGDVYLVQSGDTLERIARKVLNDGRRWRDIYEWNREQLRDPSVLRIGQKLKIKKDAGAAEASHEQPRQQESAEPAPRRTVAAHEETTDEAVEQPARPEPAGRVEPLQRWMP